MSFSVPTSPAMTRSAHAKAQPVTPQRIPRQQLRPQSFYRSPLTPSTSPYTPMSLRSFDSTGSSTLTTPDNLSIGVKKRIAFANGSPDVRSANGNQDKSIADIADNWRSRASENGIKVAFGAQDDSSYVADDSSDMSMSDVANDSVMLPTEEDILTSASFATHRRMNSLPVTTRPRALSQTSLPRSRVPPSPPAMSANQNRAPPPMSPLQQRRATSMNHSLNLMSTPPPNRALARQLKLKGSVTDPAQPRRREAFGSVSNAHNMGTRNGNLSLTLEHDTSLDLFDIDENDFEYENQSDVEDSFSRNLQALQSHSFGYPTFASRLSQGHQDSFNQPAFVDPFHPGNTSMGLLNSHLMNGITQTVDHHFQAPRQSSLQKPYFDDVRQNAHLFYPTVERLQPMYNHVASQVYTTSSFPPMHQHSLLPMQLPASMHQNAVSDTSFSLRGGRQNSHSGAPDGLGSELEVHTGCSVCLASKPERLAILQPCRHPLCSSCLTSAVNIVGEKNMECAVCKQSVVKFDLVTSKPGGRSGKDFNSNSSEDSTSTSGNKSLLANALIMEPLFSSMSSSNGSDLDEANNLNGDLESAFEFGLDLDELRASTPKLEHQKPDYSQSRSHLNVSPGSRHRSEENVVLRIDNVPWDITPQLIKSWLQQPVERVHVLLDSKGKTLSHAYVEVKTAQIAGAILRGETSSASGKKERGSVLGRGRRARGVTITKSGQQELMHDLFPNWLGNFDVSRSSLNGHDGSRVFNTPDGPVLTEQEISSLAYLIREQDSHFLKVPSLPFHSLISILGKFPADGENRGFPSYRIRDMLFDTTYTAIQTLMPRIRKVAENVKSGPKHQEEEFTVDLAVDLLHTALDCKAFTNQQTCMLAELANTLSLPLPDRGHSDVFDLSLSSISGSGVLRTPPAQNESLFKQNIASPTRLDQLAREFGVDPQVVQALAERLTNLP